MTAETETAMSAAPAATEATGTAPAAPAVEAVVADAVAAQIYAPKNLPPDMLGKTDQETIDKLAARYAGLRTKLAEAGSVPEKPDGYTIAFEGDLKAHGDALNGDPVFTEIKAAMHEAGVPDKAFQKVTGKVMEYLLKTGQLEPPFDADKEMAALFPNEPDVGQRKAMTARAVTDNVAFLDGLKTAGLPAGALDLAKSLQGQAGGVQLVQFMAQKMTGGGGGPLTSGATAQPVNEAALDARFADARNDPQSSKFERAFAEETQRLVRQFYA